ncbi:MAG: hypothetical protein DRI26_03170 [Chloroflexi bacterium]|nr:MAG: hypothetical protein DRI26_03170 [Chloroflexota bacterium]
MEVIASNAMLQQIADSLADELFVIDGEYRVRFANLAACQKLAVSAESPLGKLCYEVFQGRDRPCAPPLWECPLLRVMESGNPVEVVHPQMFPGVGPFDKYISLSLSPLRDEQGVNAVVELRRDVSAEREVEKQILRRHHQLLVLNHISRAVSGLRDLDTVLKVALDNVLELINGSIGGMLLLDERSKVLSYKVYRGLSAKHTEELRIRLGEGITGRVAESGEPILLEDISKEPQAARPDLLSIEGLKGFVSVPLVSKGKVIGVMNVASHAPGRFTADDMYLLNSIGHQLGVALEQAKLYEQLSRGKERYRRLLRYALMAQEEERKRIARELHDETSQSLTGLALNLQAIIETAELEGPADREMLERLKKVHALSVQACNEITRLINNLRPTLLDALGLVPAIRRQAEIVLKPRGINVVVESRGKERRLPSDVEVAFFRITQEAMSNIVRHSEAKNALICLEWLDDEVVLHIEDDGRGFDVSQITGIDASGRGVGLFSMKERVSLAGGSCAVHSRPGEGTKIVARVPLRQGESDAEDQGTDSG